MILAEGGSCSGEIMLRTQGTEDRPAAYTITRLRQTGAEDQGGLVVILYDLTENKKLEENLKQVSTLAALGEMAATVAHEIRNPLAGISGFTALLLRDLDKGSESRRLVEKISEGVASLNAIVSSLLKYTRSIKPQICEVDAVQAVEDAISEIKTGSDVDGQSIELVSGARSLTASLDPHLFRMIIFNLVKNAIQASPEKGQVRLTLKNDESGMLQLVVEDCGPGIPESIRERIFTPFFTTRADGIGLGLAMVKKLTELHGGG